MVRVEGSVAVASDNLRQNGLSTLSPANDAPLSPMEEANVLSRMATRWDLISMLMR